MPKQTYLLRYSLILKRLERGPATFEEIAASLERESYLQDQSYCISLRTFQRDIRDIFSQFGIEILNEQSGERRYFINERTEHGQYAERLLQAYQLLNIVKSSQDYKKYVFLEARQPDGLQHFHGLLYAIQNRKIVTFNHYKFWDETKTDRKVHPLALKESLGRWYLVAVDLKDQKLKTFGLDRISDPDISKSSFKEKYTYDIDRMFASSFGIIAPEEQKPETIRLVFTPEQGNYVRTFQLHQSQRIISQTDEGITFELKMKITHDFIMELLRYGPELTVISPKDLGKELKRQALLLASKY